MRRAGACWKHARPMAHHLTPAKEQTTMSTKSVARPALRSVAPAAPPALAPEIPLEQVTIRWTLPVAWRSDREGDTFTMTGQQLAALLEWFARTHATGSRDMSHALKAFGGGFGPGLMLRALGDTLVAASTGDDVRECSEGVMWMLGEVLRDLTARADAVNFPEERVLTSAVVVIGGQA